MRFLRNCQALSGWFLVGVGCILAMPFVVPACIPIAGGLYLLGFFKTEDESDLYPSEDEIGSWQ